MLLGVNPSQTDIGNQENPPEKSDLDPPPPPTGRSSYSLDSERLHGESPATGSCTFTNPFPRINPETPKGAIQSSSYKDSVALAATKI